ncbi:c-di-GMP-binding flagellar brake protein YcgR [Anoxybacillus calidus]|jgi:c-di-GMP-binding flagellar brake protein YcgR|uniref:C-di-GMP-binding flagellar brake protein YcgR n=1 Tax=[Anoxybacillus] calidus TaxID=575178 RepID=A0A7V9YXL3_9BACL|nr:flagellar brake domain-containing protein [Anoxybacillus calidus]MBA2870148.1 c-di-GMP-binding flagellar brake protein YcgR [Anoxybacillus calidus]
MLKIGSTLILEPINGQTEHKYKCKVAEIFPNSIHINYPVNMETGRTVFLLNGMQFKASFVSNDHSLYLFDTEVTGKIKQPIPLVVLSYPGEQQLIRIQRRQYVRVEANVDVAIHPLNGKFSPFTTVTSDISAGGAAIVLPHKIKGFEPGMTVDVWLVLHMRSGDIHYLNIPSKVVRIFKVEHSSVEKASLQFLNMTQQERLLLIRYSFEKQLEQRQKGIGEE